MYVKYIKVKSITKRLKDLYKIKTLLLFENCFKMPIIRISEGRGVVYQL
jgi:hypothetical protein